MVKGFKVVIEETLRTCWDTVVGREKDDVTTLHDCELINERGVWGRVLVFCEGTCRRPLGS